ncbi:hypothetical protein [Aureivirga sp. CE67]|uniref:hypothetical protein n=1 Tax=Aureivirga sp. CE67 TaxID=1788983 RepID=UPI0018C96C80|nr:hypothetical protein [Aureivirga sp. CE67]
MFTNLAPTYISIAFLIAILFPIFMIANLVSNTKQNHKRLLIIGFYFLYLILVSILTFTGVFNVDSFPPRIILFTTLPLLLFYFLFVFNTNFYKSFLKQVKLSKLIRVHSFRLIGTFFLILYAFDQLPKSFAYLAGFGDIFIAISSLWVAYLVEKKTKSSRFIALLWNTFGFIDILLTSITAIYLTKLQIETGSPGVAILTKFPFSFIPAFAPATIIFLHISIYLKIWNKKYTIYY